MIKELRPFIKLNMVKPNICICCTFTAIYHFGTLTFSAIKDFKKKNINTKMKTADNPT